MTVTIIVPISRDNFLPQFFASLEALECDMEQTRLCIIVDGGQALFEKVQRGVANSKYRFRTTLRMRNRGPVNVSSVRRRRRRIAEIHNEMKTLLPESDYVFLTEDDTLVPPFALKRLLAIAAESPNFLFYSGIEIGRHGIPLIGAWVTIPNGLQSVEMTHGRRQVKAAGFYCFLTDTRRYKEHTFAPYETILGPDVNFGMDYPTPGIIDYDIQCEHLMLKNSLTFDTMQTSRLRVTRDPNKPTHWLQETLDI